MKKSETTDPIQNILVSYSEEKLQSTVVEPLLRAIGFRDVRDRSGPNERGKDLTAIKDEAFGKQYYAIQIKKTKLSGKVSSSDSLAFLVNQLRQAIQEKIVFPSEMEPIKPNRLVFITPFPMETSAACSLEASLVDVKSQGVSIIDGVQLSDLIRLHLPEFLTGEQLYRKNVFENNESMLEANIALQTNRTIEMQQTYVDLFIADRKDILTTLINPKRDIDNALLTGKVSKEDTELIDQLSTGAFPFSYKNVEFNKSRKIFKNKLGKSIIWPIKETEFNPGDIYSQTTSLSLFSGLIESADFCQKTLLEKRAKPEQISTAFKKLLDINVFLKAFLKVPFYNKI